MFVVNGVNRFQIMTTSRIEELSFTPTIILNDKKILIRGLEKDVPKLQTELMRFNNQVTIDSVSDEIFPWNQVDLHWSSPKFKDFLNEALPTIMQRLNSFSNSKFNISIPFQKSALKVPLISCYDGSFENKAI